jgi:hypothetical protein
MTDEELVERLRSYAKDQGGWHNIDDTCEEAADRIEQLVAINEALTKERDEQIEWVKRLADMQIASEVKLATCEKYRDAYAECDRIGTQAVRDLEAKLAKAVEALIWCSGSADFNEGGIAEAGWQKVCAPLIAKHGEQP